MTAKTTIAADLRRRQPSIDDAGVSMLRRLVEHCDAPAWNHVAGDRLGAEDLAWLDRFRDLLASERRPFAAGPPPATVLVDLVARASTSPLLADRLDTVSDVEAQWAQLPTMCREDLALRIGELVPLDAPLDDCLVYCTAGTTGHPLRVPHHRRAVAGYLAFIETALRHYSVDLDVGPGVVGAFLVGAQRHTVTYPCVLSGWGNAGFAKLNLDGAGWPRPGAARRYIEELQPRLLTADPISLAELLRQGIETRPRAAISTAVAMSPTLREAVQSHLRAPVVDWYSLTETGPLGYLCSRAGQGEPEAYHVLPHDVHIEVVDDDGQAVIDGERGEIVVSGGRNPFVPLLRYRTGDWGALLRAPCSCGDPMPRLVGLQGRRPVLFHGADGEVVNPVDLARELRRFPLVSHEFEQDERGVCSLRYRPLPGRNLDTDRLRGALALLLGERPGGQPLSLIDDPELGSRPGKPQPWRSAMTLELLLQTREDDAQGGQR